MHQPVAFPVPEDQRVEVPAANSNSFIRLTASWPRPRALTRLVAAGAMLCHEASQVPGTDGLDQLVEGAQQLGRRLNRIAQQGYYLSLKQFLPAVQSFALRSRPERAPYIEDVVENSLKMVL